ncbi:MAG: peptide synthase, partial [Candidatus Riflebacteria bacterium]|nr:peptide synthase [Candidatus Riflebacteria bacterium]
NRHESVFRTALVGIGERGQQIPVLWVELEKGISNPDFDKIIKELSTLGAEFPHTRLIKKFLFHSAFPVDVRHNAKIGRELLATLAAKQLKSAEALTSRS